MRNSGNNQDMQAKLINWMMGRNGFDDFARAALGFAVVAMLLQFIFGIFSGFLSSLFSYISLALFIYAGFRVLSKNVIARQRENREWIKRWTPIVIPCRRKYSQFKEWKTYHKEYKIMTCKTCGQSLRIPKGKGKVRVTCPKCRNVFEDQA